MIKKKAIDFLNAVKWFGFRKLYWLIKNASETTGDYLIDLGFISGKKNQAFIKRNVSRWLINEYGGDEGHNINFHQFFLGFGLIHYSFIRNLRPINILCVGSSKGFIPAILALACKDNAIGHVDFVDAGYDKSQPAKHWGGTGFWKNFNPSKHFKKLGIDDYITTHVMTTQEYADKFPKMRYQYVYIDGDHSYEGIRLDYGLFWPCLDMYGFMLFHDVVARGRLDKGIFGIWKFWNELKNTNKIILPFPKDSGLGILQKIPDANSVYQK